MTGKRFSCNGLMRRVVMSLGSNQGNGAVASSDMTIMMKPRLATVVTMTDRPGQKSKAVGNDGNAGDVQSNIS